MAFGDLGVGVGEMINAFGPGPKYNVLSLTKWPQLQKFIDQGLTDYSGLVSKGQAGLKDFINRYLQATKDAEKYAPEETAAISKFYTGGAASELAGLRARREAAINAAADVATKQALRGVAGAQLAQQGGGLGSYASRLALGAVTPIRVQAALDTANQERSDWGYVTGQQLGLTGARTSIADALAGRALVPYQTGLGLLQGQQSYLSNLENMNLANKFYGINRQPTLGDRIIAFSKGAGDFMSGVATAYGAAAGAMGGMGGMGGGMGGMGGMMGGGGGGAGAGAAGAGINGGGAWGALGGMLQGGGQSIGGGGGGGGGSGGGGGGRSYGTSDTLHPTQFGESLGYVPTNSPTLGGWGFPASSYGPAYGTGASLYGNPGLGNYGY